MSDIPIKSFVLQGNLTLPYLSYQFANNETQNGLWQITIKDISYSSIAEVNYIVRLSTNLVKDLRFRNNKRETYHPCIATFLLKAKPSEKKKFQFERNWFQINCSDSELRLHFINAETEKAISSDCLIFVTVLLQQIK